MQPAKLKLIYVVTQAEWGGAQRYIFDLATALKDEFDILVTAGVGGSQELLQKCKEAGVRTHTFKNLVREVNPLKDITAIFELARFFKQEKPDIVHLNSSKAGLVGALARQLQIADYRLQNDAPGVIPSVARDLTCFLKPRMRSFGLRPQDDTSVSSEIVNLKSKIIYTAHGWVFNEPLSFWRRKLYMILERAACKIHNKVIVLSQADFDVAVKNKICLPEKMVIISHGIKPIDFFSHEEAKERLATTYNLQPTTLWIGTIANLYKTKGLEYLIDAAKELRNHGVCPNFIVIGDGRERRNYELRIKDYGLNNFPLIGAIPDAAKYLRAFDVFAFPSLKEGLPYALLEAMQAGLPVIATDVGAIPEMIENEKNGLIVKPKDSKMLREAIEKLLNNEGLRNNLGEETQKTFKEKFDFDAMIQKTLKVYTTDS